jgi:hypothetical protein
VWSWFFGPSQEEINQVVRGLIAQHGPDAYNEAIYLAAAVSLLSRPRRQQRLYERAADQIKRSLEQVRE